MVVMRCKGPSWSDKVFASKASNRFLTEPYCAPGHSVTPLRADHSPTLTLHRWEPSREAQLGDLSDHPAGRLGADFTVEGKPALWSKALAQRLSQVSRMGSAPGRHRPDHERTSPRPRFCRSCPAPS